MGWLLQGHFGDTRTSSHDPLLPQCLWAVLHRTRLWAAEGCYRHELHLRHYSWYSEAFHFVLVTASLPLKERKARWRKAWELRQRGYRGTVSIFFTHMLLTQTQKDWIRFNISNFNGCVPWKPKKNVLINDSIRWDEKTFDNIVFCHGWSSRMMKDEDEDGNIVQDINQKLTLTLT